ncbi:MAG: hypothetical protein K9L17_07800 [Clostridiales bacterium]|nr:hypothetical protein [Clostridiales bacterium]MCF8022576.1 hypothetical protein [Clostridiales bacterium]
MDSSNFDSEESGAGLELGTLAPDEQQIYTLTVYFPEGSGNDYQGKTADVYFVFNARGHNKDVEPGTGAVFEHPFINNNFALRMNSTVPIKFYLVKEDGTYDNMRRDVDLVITGPDAEGNPQEIVFNRSNENLKFLGELNKPYYMALLSSFDYSLKVGEEYTAVVKSGDEVLATRDFNVNEDLVPAEATVLNNRKY